ncbi:unnamed protein product [Penicillium camemberti]|uniref:Str. FM013 n=1 Tax=Penicillium camemberti (strain FM 013) TaxID=1429867 RepID=A0A0G4NYI2_PENC3|nr:unnamed protein product [Penicillium camemberti]
MTNRTGLYVQMDGRAFGLAVVVGDHLAPLLWIPVHPQLECRLIPSCRIASGR